MPIGKGLIRHDARGWTLEVLNVVRALNKNEFTLQDVYAFAGDYLAVIGADIDPRKPEA